MIRRDDIAVPGGYGICYGIPSHRYRAPTYFDSDARQLWIMRCFGGSVREQLVIALYDHLISRGESNIKVFFVRDMNNPCWPEQHRQPAESYSALLEQLHWEQRLSDEMRADFRAERERLLSRIAELEARKARLPLPLIKLLAWRGR